MCVAAPGRRVLLSEAAAAVLGPAPLLPRLWAVVERHGDPRRMMTDPACSLVVCNVPAAVGERAVRRHLERHGTTLVEDVVAVRPGMFQIVYESTSAAAEAHRILSGRTQLIAGQRIAITRADQPTPPGAARAPIADRASLSHGPDRERPPAPAARRGPGRPPPDVVLLGAPWEYAAEEIGRWLTKLGIAAAHVVRRGEFVHLWLPAGADATATVAALDGRQLASRTVRARLSRERERAAARRCPSCAAPLQPGERVW